MQGQCSTGQRSLTLYTTICLDARCQASVNLSRHTHFPPISVPFEGQDVTKSVEAIQWQQAASVESKMY